MAPTAVSATVVFTMFMLMVMVAASYIRVEFQRPVDQSFDGFIGTARNAAIQVDKGFRQGLFRSAADTAGNDSIDFLSLQEADQGAVSLAIGADDVGFDDIAVFDIINLELCRMAEMLEYIPIFIRNCYSHHNNSSSKMQ